MMLAAYGMSGRGGVCSPCSTRRLSRAERLAGVTPGAYSARGARASHVERRLEEAESELLRAAQEGPDLALPHIGLSTCYASMGRLDDALDSVARARRRMRSIRRCPRRRYRSACGGASTRSQ